MWKSNTKSSNIRNKYIPSMYVKEELPTWSEVYDEFYMNKMFQFNPTTDADDIDPFWQIPKKKYIMAIVSNQFNHMIYETELVKRDLLKMVQREFKNRQYHVDAISFTCEPDSHDPAYYNKMAIGIKGNPLIYTINHPQGTKNPFITNDMNRIILNDYYPNNVLLFTVVINATNTINGEHIVFMINHDSDPDIFHMIIEYMIAPYKEYFEGEAVGWKDENGHVITSIDEHITE